MGSRPLIGLAEGVMLQCITGEWRNSCKAILGLNSIILLFYLEEFPEFIILEYNSTVDYMLSMLSILFHLILPALLLSCCRL